MSLRRGSRLRDSPNQKLSDAPQDASDQAGKGRKRKVMVQNTDNLVVLSPPNVKKAKGSSAKTVTAAVAARCGVLGLDELLALTPEIFHNITDNIQDKRAISALCRTNRKLYNLVTPQLYRRVAVAAMFHAHIAKVIRTLEPHLTIKQKKQLKNEGKYKGQQEKYSASLDENKIPICASYVQQLVIGVSDPGKKHKFIVERYYEEGLKNMASLDMVETHVLNKSISENIASLPCLSALSIHAYSAKSEDLSPLTKIKNLKHLHLEIDSELLTIAQIIIRNSMSTLRSLDIVTNWGIQHFLHKWSTNLKSSGLGNASSDGKVPDLPALRSLRIEDILIDKEFIKEFDRAIDFPKLRKFTFVDSEDSEHLLWPFLTTKITSYRHSGIEIHLQTLSINMHEIIDQYQPEPQKSQSAVKCQFIACFDTLTTLELPGYGQYSSNATTKNPGLSDNLMNAILQHKNLKVLRICYTGIISGMKIPYLGAKQVGKLIDGLPCLREFEFAPDESQMNEIGQALSRSKNLERIICYPHESWDTGPPSEALGVNILTSILSSFMSNAKLENESREFVWEHHYRLSHLDLRHKGWAIASHFGKRGKGVAKPERFQVDVEGATREVLYQLIPTVHHIHVGYDPTFEWMTEVEKDL